jgi:hypothetical protein
MHPGAQLSSDYEGGSRILSPGEDTKTIESRLLVDGWIELDANGADIQQSHGRSD